MIVIIDNYDSFVHNLARYVRELGFQTHVVRNDKITLNEIEKINPSHLIISPGPCAPDQAGISLQVIKFFANKIPILGVCLGHQAIGQAFGAEIIRATKPMHGKSSNIFHDRKSIFKNMKNPFIAGRYHSLIVSENNFPKDLLITARCEEGQIMAIEHRKFPVFGIQFHLESILTEQGYQLLENFLKGLKPNLSK